MNPRSLWCFVMGLCAFWLGCGDEPPALEPLEHTLGEFSFHWNAPEEPWQLSVLDAGQPERVLWQSSTDVAWLRIGRGTPTVQDSAGSFSIQDAVGVMCELPVVDSVEAIEGALRVQGAFTDCPASFQLDFEPVGPRELRFALGIESEGESPYNRTWLATSSVEGEVVVGLGAQYNEVDLNGQRVPIWCQEQGHGRGLEPLSSLFNSTVEGVEPAGNASTTYSCIPAHLTSSGRAEVLENTEYMVLDFRAPEHQVLEVWSDEVMGRVFLGSDPASQLEALTSFTGRMAPLPSWSQQGPIIRVHGGSDAVRDSVAELLDISAPLAAVWVEDWCGVRDTITGKRMWWNWVVDTTLYPDWEALISELGAQGVRVLIYANPYLTDASEKEDATRNLHGEALELEYLVRRKDGTLFEMEQGGFQANIVDLTNPAARTWLKSALAVPLEAGVSGWMADFAEALPFDAVLHDGRTGAEAHNDFPVEWAAMNRELVEEAGVFDEHVAFSRSAGTRSPGVVRLFWLGDQLVTWDAFDGLATVVPGLLSSGLSGLTLQHSDTGGYLSMPPIQLTRTKELFQRWMELNAFTVALRMHSTNFPDQNHQYNSDPETLAHFIRFSELFKALAPYREECMSEAHASGLPVVRAMLLEHPESPEAWTLFEQFMLGSDVVVAPVLKEGADTVEAVLPPGSWVHLWSQELEGPHAGFTPVSVEAPIGEPGVWVREGSAAARLLKPFAKESSGGGE